MDLQQIATIGLAADMDPFHKTVMTPVMNQTSVALSDGHRRAPSPEY